MKNRTHHKEPLNKLMLELAYTGPLFWLPLLVCPREKDAKYHANQGLWVLIMAAVACTGICLMSMLTSWVGGGIAGILLGGIYALLYIVFLMAMLYLLWSVYDRAMRIHGNKKPHSILFFENHPIIK